MLLKLSIDTNLKVIGCRSQVSSASLSLLRLAMSHRVGEVVEVYSSHYGWVPGTIRAIGAETVDVTMNMEKKIPHAQLAQYIRAPSAAPSAFQPIQLGMHHDSAAKLEEAEKLGVPILILDVSVTTRNNTSSVKELRIPSNATLAHLYINSQEVCSAFCSIVPGRSPEVSIEGSGTHFDIDDYPNVPLSQLGFKSGMKVNCSEPPR
eukprot:TRINITY_DN9705_c0_g1_i2.p2 TRINITY_DN9705_c0_g1~~TRINITY_DN9705_c0_g1_i2.p2  ORF type:complete len:206 (+),score=14.37 TRINITY_DN9705_c0_g1_i2:127-744(+)